MVGLVGTRMPAYSNVMLVVPSRGSYSELSTGACRHPEDQPTDFTQPRGEQISGPLEALTTHADLPCPSGISLGSAQIPRCILEGLKHRVRMDTPSPVSVSAFSAISSVLTDLLSFTFLRRSVDVLAFCRTSLYSSLDMWYLHAPDRTTPWEVTLKAVDELYKEGKFKRFGISNFRA